MHKKYYLHAAILGLILMSLLLAACSPGSEPPTQSQPAQTAAPSAIDGATLLSERCTKCHTLERVQTKHKTLDEWKTTVDRMVGKGAALDAKEVEILVEYLSKTYGP